MRNVAGTISLGRQHSLPSYTHMRFVIGVDNLLDQQPPIVGTNAADANTFPQSYDVIGRRFGVSVTLRN